MSARELKRYFGWNGYDDMVLAFSSRGWDEESPVSLPAGFPTEAEMLCAFVRTENYESSARLYFERGGELFEAECGHCSCYGYSDSQAQPAWSALAPVSREYLQRAPGWVVKEFLQETAAQVCWDALTEGSLRAG
jgi:hypothetical protein